MIVKNVKKAKQNNHELISIVLQHLMAVFNTYWQEKLFITLFRLSFIWASNRFPAIFKNSDLTEGTNNSKLLKCKVDYKHWQ